MEKHSSSAVFKIAVALIFVCLAVVMGYAISKNYFAGETVIAEDAESANLLKQESDKRQLIVEQDADTPLLIVEAIADVVTPEVYQRLTNEKTDLSQVFSNPAVKLKNVSGKEISEVMLILHDNATEKSTGLLVRPIKLEPGKTLNIDPAAFVGKAKSFSIGADNNVAPAQALAPSRDLDYWTKFDNIDNIRVRVAVTFADGEKWVNKNQRK